MRQPLVLRGRSAPVTEALVVLRRAKRTGQGGAVIVGGEPGIGKSALLYTLQREGRATGFGIGTAKAMTADQLAPGSSILLALRAGQQPLFTGQQLAAAATLVDEPAIFVDHLAALLEELARTRPILIALDDVQWIDPLSRDAARILIERTAACPIVWLIAARGPAAAIAQTMEHGSAQLCVIDLAPLKDTDLLDLARDFLGEPADEATAALLGRVGGNPFYARQVLDAVVHARSRGEAVAQLPPEFVSGLRRQLAKVPPLPLRLLRLMAVLGRPVNFAECCALAPTDSTEAVSDAMDVVIQHGWAAYEGHLLGFQHDLVREAVYEELTSGQRRELHAECAAFLLADGAGPLAAARHIQGGALPGDGNSAALLLDAAYEALMSMPASAATLAIAGYRLLRHDHESWYSIGLSAIQILVSTQRGSEAIALADGMLARTTSPELMAQIETEIAQALFEASRMTELAARTRARLSDEPISDRMRARLRANAALASIGFEPAETIRVWAHEARSLACRVDDPPALETADYALAVLALNHGAHAKTVQRFRDLRTRVGDKYTAHEILGLQLLDRFDEAQNILTNATQSPKTASLPWVSYAQMWQDIELGRLDDADSAARTVIALSQEFGNRGFELDANSVLALLALFHGDVEGAERHLDERTRLTSGDDRVQTETTELMRALVSAARGDLVTAVATLRPRIEEALDGTAYWPWWPGWLPSFAKIFLAAGDGTLAKQTVTLAEEAVARNPGVGSFEGIAYQVQGLVNGDTELLRRADAVLAVNPRPPLRGMAAEDLGRALVMSGARSEGIKHLDRAWKVYTDFGMGGPADLVRSLMSSIGVRRAAWAERPRRPVSGWDSLTPAERNVARLIGSGLTNRAAAAELGLSPNTIGTHIRSVFAKLEVRSRVQLTNLIHQRADEVASS